MSASRGWSSRPWLLLVFLACWQGACASSNVDGPNTGRTPLTPPSVAVGDIAANAGSVDDGLAAGVETLDAPLESVVDQVSAHRQALDNALEWSREGVGLYRAGDDAGAFKALNDARIALLDADLPEAMQELGLGVVVGALGADYAGIDLVALTEQLERRDAKAGPEPEARYIELEARRILNKFGAASPDERYLATFVDQVQVFVDYYRGRNREFFERAYRRKHKYWPTIRSVFDAKGIPEELGYMALVESGFKPRARSHADAQGLWQFIPATGRRYGLRNRTDLYDVERSTEAASEYLLDLIGIFGSRSFLLATAAYNAGEGRILRCLRDLDDPFGDRTFWAIQPCLAKETREYVPRIFAAAIIGSDPGRFGFDLPSADDLSETYDVVTIPEPTSLAHIARDAGVSVAALRTANTDLSPRASSTPVRNFPLYVPKGAGRALIADLSASSGAALSSTEMPGTASAVAEMAAADVVLPADPPAGVKIEVDVAAGDTVAEIAQRHGVSSADLKRWNPFLARRILYRGDRLTVYQPRAQPQAQQPSVYRVRSGDTLGGIAQRHGVKVADLVRWNGLGSAHRIQVGQRLEMHSTAPTRLTYTVQLGNTLQTIAQIFEVRYRDIMAWNRLPSSRLKAGQKLKIQPSRRFEIDQHRVRRGDTVGKIARRYGTSVTSVIVANGLSRRGTIRLGQQLVVFSPQDGAWQSASGRGR